jgi:hypothetical protein
MSKEQFDRAMRVRIDGSSAGGSISRLTPFSSHWKAKLARSAAVTAPLPAKGRTDWVMGATFSPTASAW